MITQIPREPRLRYLLRVAIAHILEHAPDLTTDYDETTCDGYCIADELKVEMECLPETEPENQE